MDGIVVDALSGFWGLEEGSCKGVEGESHEDAVEPYLIAVDGFVPKDAIGFSAWLLMELAHEGLYGNLAIGLLMELVHSCNKMTSTDVVEIILIESIPLNIALRADHGVDILLSLVSSN